MIACRFFHAPRLAHAAAAAQENFPALAAGEISDFIAAVTFRLLLAAIFLPQVMAAEKSPPPLDAWLHRQFPESAAWDIGGEIRARYENHNGGGGSGSTDFISGVAESRDAFLFREKIHAGYQASWLGWFIEGRDASGHSDDRANDVFDLFQAFITLGDAESFPLTAKIGRQEIFYGDERIVGRSNWTNPGRSFDAIRLRLESECGWVEAFTGRVVLVDDNNFNISNDYDNFSGIYASSDTLLPWQQTQAYFLARNYGVKGPNALGPGNTGGSQRDIYTIGTLWKSHADAFGGWDYSAEALYQFGSVYDSAQGRRLDQRSHGVFLEVGHAWKDVAWSPRIGLGYEYGSGDSDPSDGKVGTYENLFGAQHNFYGTMDLAGARNMHIPKLQLSASPARGVTLNAAYLAFFLADTADSFYPEKGPGRSGNGYGINPGYGSFAGSEIDAYANWAVTDQAACQVGYGHFFTGNYVEDSAGPAATGADFFYTQLLLTF